MVDGEGRENHIGTIEYTRKMLAFLETLEQPTALAVEMMRQHRAEIAGWEYAKRAASDEFHDVAGANV